MKTWFNFKAKAESPDAVEISIFDEIGMWGVNARDFISELKSHSGKSVSLAINSPGGSVFDALAIYNALRAHGGEINVRILGVAASAASLIAMAGDKITMPENTFLMVHNPWAVAAGNAEELRDFADTLDTIGSSLVKTYVARTGMSEDEIKQLLADETWLTAEEAVAKGFATEMEPALKVAAKFYTDRLPENVKAAIVTVTVEESETGPDGEQETTTTTVTTWSGDDSESESPDGEGDGEANAQTLLASTVAQMAKDAGFDAYGAVFALNPAVKVADDAKALIEHAAAVKDLCDVAGKGDMADNLIRSFASLDEARSAICAALADEADKQHTSNTQAPPNAQTADTATNVWAKVWAKVSPTRRA